MFKSLQSDVHFKYKSLIKQVIQEVKKKQYTGSYFDDEFDYLVSDIAEQLDKNFNLDGDSYNYFLEAIVEGLVK